MSNLVSIIIPVYNAESYIQETLISVIAQTYANWECLIIDDGSTDNTAGIAERFIREDSRIHYFYKSNGGLSVARNYGLSVSKGDYIQYLDSDDILFKDKLASMVTKYDYLNQANMILFCDFIYGLNNDVYKKDSKYFKLFKDFNSDKKMGFNTLYLKWDYTITIPIHCFLFPKSTIKGISFDENLKSKEDWDYYLTIMATNKDVYFSPYNYTGCSYRVSTNGMSKNYTEMISSSLIVLYKFNKNTAFYLYRLTHFILQAYLYKIKQKRIFLNQILIVVKNKHKHYYAVLFAIFLLMPVALLLKLYNIIKIRLIA